MFKFAWHAPWRVASLMMVGLFGCLPVVGCGDDKESGGGNTGGASSNAGTGNGAGTSGKGTGGAGGSGQGGTAGLGSGAGGTATAGGTTGVQSGTTGGSGGVQSSSTAGGSSAVQSSAVGGAGGVQATGTGGQVGTSVGGSAVPSTGGGTGVSSNTGVGGATATLCSNTCPYANDGQCDDGGPGAKFSACALGTDCQDCGPRTAGGNGGSGGLGGSGGATGSPGGGGGVGTGGVATGTGSQAVGGQGGATVGTGGTSIGGTGTAPIGGSSGAATGGSPTTGGASAASGGAATGGSASGGVTAATGGAATGGAATGGVSSATGGAATGGISAATGGAATGGISAATGGAATGGAATGGTATGGTAAGGNTAASGGMSSTGGNTGTGGAPIGTLCQPCNDSGDCVGGKCLWQQVTGENVCGLDCTSTACPSGYSCADVGGGSLQCVPSSDTCNAGPYQGPATTPLPDNIIDNMDDCDGNINPADGRQGSWFTFNSNCDVTTKGKQTPPASPCTGNFIQKFEMTPMTQGCAARTSGSGFPSNGWAAMGVSLAYNDGVYNACKWDGIKVTVTGSAVRMEVRVPPFDSTNDLSIELAAGTYSIPWYKFVSPSTTSPKSFDCSQVQAIFFRPTSLSSFDFTVDDLEFVKDEPSPVATGCGGSSVGRYFCDDMESGPSKWTMSGQDWALIDSTARSTPHSLTDSPAGNYANDADAAVTLAGNVDLTGATAPVLHFWDKLAIGCANYTDYAYLEISRDGGLTWSQLSRLSCSSNTTTWRQLQFDLAAYVGARIKIRFRVWDYGDGTNYTADGWYVDDVVVEEAPAAMTGTGAGGCTAETSKRYFCDSFEFGLSDWSLSGQDWNTTVFEARTGTRSATDSPKGKYANDSDAAIGLARPIDLTQATSPVLTFWHKLAIGCANYNDYAYVEVSVDRGTTWAQLARYSCSNNTSTWSLQQLDLKSYAGKQVMVRFRVWDYGDGSNYTADGWYVDDVEVRELF